MKTYPETAELRDLSSASREEIQKATLEELLHNITAITASTVTTAEKGNLDQAATKYDQVEMIKDEVRWRFEVMEKALKLSMECLSEAVETKQNVLEVVLAHSLQRLKKKDEEEEARG